MEKKKKGKLAANAMKMHSRGRSSPESLAFCACKTPRHRADYCLEMDYVGKWTNIALWQAKPGWPFCYQKILSPQNVEALITTDN